MANQLPALNVAGINAMPNSPMVPLHYVHPGLSLAQLFAILRARRKRIAAIFVGLSVACIGMATLLPKTYEATASLLIRHEVNDPLGGKEFPVGLLGSYVSTQMELLQSPGVLLPAIEQTGLTSDHHYIDDFDGRPESLATWVMEKLRNRLSVTQTTPNSQLVHVTYAAMSPSQAAAVANAVVDVYVRQQNERLAAPATTEAGRYAEQLEELRQKAQHAQEQLTSFRDRNDLLETSGNVDIEMEMLSTLEQKLLEAQSAKREAEARIAGDVSVGRSVMDSQLVQKLKTQLAELDARHAEWQSSLGARHPDMVALEAQIAQIRRSLGAEISTYSKAGGSELIAARTQERKLQEAVAAQRERLLHVRQLRDEAAHYELELSSAQAVYKRALDGYDQVAFASQGRYSNVIVESRAMEPLRPSRPKLLKLAVLGLMFSAVVALLVPLGLELVDRHVRCRDDIERDHGVPVLMEFPALPAPRSE